MIKQFFQTKTEHSELKDEKLVNVFNSIFINCVAPRGGGIYIEYPSSHRIEFCIFSRCNATFSSSTDGRGGAFYVGAGRLFVKFCCAYECSSAIGSDMMCSSQSHPSLYCIQSFGSINKYHSMWTKVSSVSSFKYLNVTGSKVSAPQNEYGNGINFYLTEVPLMISYLNLNNNDGASEILQFEGGQGLTVAVSNVNMINNNNQESYIYFRTCSLVHIILLNSFIIDNKGNNFYSTDNNLECSIEFHSTSFSRSNPSTSLQNIKISEDCRFLQTFKEDFSTDEKCLFIFRMTERQCFLLRRNLCFNLLIFSVLFSFTLS